MREGGPEPDGKPPASPWPGGGGGADGRPGPADPGETGAEAGASAGGAGADGQGAAPEARSSTWPGGATRDSAPPPPPTPDPVQHVAPPDADTLDVACVATRAPLFRLALRTGALTVLTLGVYRFWMKTRLRRWYWSSVRPGGLPMEYVGEPLEKLLGFLTAVVVLAFYIGVVNLALMFLSLSLLEGSAPALLLSLVGVIPIWFYATYRARRYRLARTRWRGLRFGLEPGAWGYAARALGHWAATILTLGVLWPRMTFGLEKFVTDRTRFGDTALHQGGEWRMLWPAFVHAAGGGYLSLAVGLVATGEPGMIWMLLGTVPWFLYGLVHYSVESKRLMTEAKTAGPLGLVSRADPRRVLRIYLFGGIAALVALILPLAALGMALVAVEMSLEEAGELPTAVLAAGGLALYIAVALIWSVLRHVFLIMPVWRHYAETLTVTGAESLGTMRQRDRDAALQAEGFAEALDIGGAM
ncbi:DUF898 family protein [Histidinibacterium lentulum]|uniref:DUF898 family protein n=1 Tax=Histidinibacterium lentulum TaxID=2480588 RepID=A0A3N2R5B7_9RHOB|nr:DUF898 family protein [Histidinibacterium lentulum]ROU02679.1 DUF898 family protein [Histidinibacterium lentulum]